MRWCCFLLLLIIFLNYAEAKNCTFERELPEVVSVSKPSIFPSKYLKEVADQDLQGSNVIVEIWPNLCKSCGSTSYKLKDMRVVRISFSETSTEFKSWLKTFIDMESEVDFKEPFTFLINPNGRILFRLKGYMPWERCGIELYLKSRVRKNDF